MGIRPFSDTLVALRYGTLHDELSEALNQLVTKCESTQRAGSLTLTLKIKPSKAGRVEIIDDIKLTLPKEEKGSSIMFVTPEGNLQREDPRQMSLDGLRVVDKQDGELKRVDPETGELRKVI